MRPLRKGNESNLLRILVDNIDIKSFAQMNGGMIDASIIIKFSRYNLDDVLCQMLEDYGEDELIKRIKGID